MKPHHPHCRNKPCSSKCLRTGRGAENWKIGLQKEGVRMKYTHTITSAHTLHAQFDKHLWNASYHKYISACLFTRRPWRMQRLANLQFSAMHWFLKQVDAWYVNIGSLCPNTSSRRYQVVTKSASLSPKHTYDFGQSTPHQTGKSNVWNLGKL